MKKRKRLNPWRERESYRKKEIEMGERREVRELDGDKKGEVQKGEEASA